MPSLGQHAVQIIYGFSSGSPRLIMALTSCLSSDQLSPAGTNSSRTCARLCKGDFVLHKYRYTRTTGDVAYERHLLTYLLSDRDRRYYFSMWLQFVSPMQPGRPIYRQIARRICYKVIKNEPFLLVSFYAIDAFLQVIAHLFLATREFRSMEISRQTETEQPMLWLVNQQTSV